MHWICFTIVSFFIEELTNNNESLSYAIFHSFKCQVMARNIWLSTVKLFAEFELSKLRDATNNQRTELEFQLNTKTENIEILKVICFDFYAYQGCGYQIKTKSKYVKHLLEVYLPYVQLSYDPKNPTAPFFNPYSIFYKPQCPSLF